MQAAPQAPRSGVLRDVLTLVELERPLWPSLSQTARAEGPVNEDPPEPEATPPADPKDGNPAPDPKNPDPDSSDDPDYKQLYEEQKQRYENLRPEADRRATLLADLEGRNGPERQAQALAEHASVELDDEEPELEEEGEFDLRDPADEIDQIKQELAERDQRDQDAEFERLEDEYIETTVKALEKEHLSEGVELSQEEFDLVRNYGLNHRDDFDGKPDLEGGMKALLAAHEAGVKRHGKYLESKEGVVPPIGVDGEPKVNLRDKDERQKLGREVYEAAERAKQ